MNIVVYSRAFVPNLGGLEVVARNCATFLQDEGHHVSVITETVETCELDQRLPIFRRARLAKKLSLVRKADVILMFNVSLRDIFMPILLAKPTVVSHQGGYRKPHNGLQVLSRLKETLTHFVTNVACSEAVKSWVNDRSVVIPNSYNDESFRIYENVRRDRDIAFVGRLVSDKGVDILLEAISLLHKRGLRPTVTVIGAGPELQNLNSLANSLNLSVEWSAPLFETELAFAMNRHKLLVVPSRWNEPFGIVALEGIACGCRVIGSKGGGLRDAIGQCGSVFTNNSSGELASLIEVELQAEGIDPNIRSEHLSRHTKRQIGREYVKILTQAAGRVKASCE